MGQLMGWLKRLLGLTKKDTPVTNQSLGVFFIYPEERRQKVERDGPLQRPPSVARVEAYRDEIAERRRQFAEWKENNNRLFSVA